ncbi:MAG: hypothetical protein IJD13_05065 [Oscillospiraceae bacterium]|nr:hypothetical protein [Oscillospiraceae bacterium]
MKYRFLADPYNSWMYTNLKRVVGTGRKDPEGALFTEEFFSGKPWEVRIDNGYPNVFYDEQAGIYRCYYTCFIRDPDSAARPLSERKTAVYQPRSDRLTGLLYACSKDGVTWEKPALGRVEFDGSKENNIVFVGAHGASVFRDEKETDPMKRYKLAMKYDLFGEMAISYSPDGLDWCEPIRWPEYNPAGDTHNFAFRDEVSGGFKIITRTWDGVRISALCESEDFLHWTQPEEILRGRDMDDQIYSMPVFRYGGLWFGLPAIFHGGDHGAKDFDRVDTELAFSHDLKHWERVPGSLIPRSEGDYGDAPDCCCIYASTPIFKGGKAVIYYMGGSGNHTNYRESSLCRFVIDPDKLMGMQALPGKTGSLLTHGIPMEGEILLAADLPEGSTLRAAVVEDVNNLYAIPVPLPGYGFEDFTPVFREDGKIVLRWKKPLSEMAGQKHSLLIETKGGTLCALLSE